MPPVRSLNRYESPAKLRDIAAELYRQERFDEALETLNSALSLRQNDSDVGLFDLRAATYCKLARYSPALSDARRMIQGWKTNAMGYLRAGKVLLQMENKHKEAMKIYQRGLKYVPKNDIRYAALQNTHDKLSKLSGSKNAQDFLVLFPLEVLEMIFASIEFRQLCRCLRVSKQWQQFLVSWPLFWSDIDFSATTRAVPVSSVYAYIEKSKFQASRVVLKNVDLQSNKLLPNLTSRCKKLSDLELMTGGLLGESLRQSLCRAASLKKLHLDQRVPVDGNTVRQVIQMCPSLVHVAFGLVRSPIPYLASLETSQWKQTDFPNLKSFALTWLRGDRPLNAHGILNVVRVESEFLCPPASNLVTLKLVRLENCDHRHDLYFDFDNLAQQRPHLEELETHGLYPSARTEHAVALPQKLRKLKFNRNYERAMEWERLLNAEQGTPALEMLEINVRGDRRVPVINILQFLACRGSSNEATPLKSLLVDIEFTPYEGLLALIEYPRLQELENLRLRGSNYHGDKIAILVAEHLTNLCYLDVSETRMTGVGVKCLVQSLKSLRFLNVDLCPDIGSDAIDWARSQGVVVSNSLR